MAKSKAAELAKEIVGDLKSTSNRNPFALIEAHLQPTFDLLAQVHKLAKANGGYQDLDKIEELTRPYDNSKVV